MRLLRLESWCTCLLAVLGANPLLAAESITVQTLLHEMVDRDALARFPKPTYRCRQASSYDRDAVSPENQESWYANWDRSQFIRTEEKEGRKEHVLLAADGPGAVVRFWATWHGPGGGPFSDGMLRIYLDHNEQPAIEGKMTDFIDKGLLTGPPLSQGVSPKTEYAHRGHNLYLPIPYAKHCKITYSTDVLVDRGAKKGEALYYQINYRTYELGTQVESFSMERLEAARPVLEKVQKRLTECIRATDPISEVVSGEGTLKPGEVSEPIIVPGPAAIRQLRLRLEADDMDQALRSTILEIDFDGRHTVWCPVGDFTGTGHKISPHTTWYTHVTKEGDLECAWVMPFAKEAVIKLHNLGEQSVTVGKAEVGVGAWQWDDHSMHFHATWRQLNKVDTRGGKNMTGQQAFDVNYVTVQGEGVYVGDTLTIFNGAAAWWGEGDEKIYVDGEKFPSHFGTGTEDYYGYAWCRPEFFNAPFHAQPEGGGNMAGGFSVNSRYRALDAIPFSKSIQFDMELWHWAGTKVNFAPATFWYARPGATSNVRPDPKSAALPVPKKREDIVPVFRAQGAIEGEAMKIVERTGGVTEIQQSGFGWSGDRQLWWREAKIGDKLVLEFTVDKAGPYKAVANLTKANDYAIVGLSIDDNPAKTFDRYHTTVAHDRLELGLFDLKQGAHRLTIEITGMNEKALMRQMFGLDYLKLEPATP